MSLVSDCDVLLNSVLPALLGSASSQINWGQISCCSGQIDCYLDENNITRVGGLHFDGGLNYTGKQITMRGFVPPSVALLSKLRHLQVSHNSLTGTLPEVISRLPLWSLWLSFNPNLGGTIPQSFSNLTELQAVNIDNTCLYGPLPWNTNNLHLKDGLGSAIGNNFCLNPGQAFPQFATGSASICNPQSNVSPKCPADESSTSTHSKLNTGEIAATIIGSICFVILIATIPFFCRMCRNRNKKPRQSIKEVKESNQSMSEHSISNDVIQKPKPSIQRTPPPHPDPSLKPSNLTEYKNIGKVDENGLWSKIMHNLTYKKMEASDNITANDSDSFTQDSEETYNLHVSKTHALPDSWDGENSFLFHQHPHPLMVKNHFPQNHGDIYNPTYLVQNSDICSACNDHAVEVGQIDNNYYRSDEVVYFGEPRR